MTGADKMMQEKAPELEGRIALITGAASGLGEVAARKLAAEGATLIVTDIDERGGAEVAASVGGQFLMLDVAREEDWLTAAAFVRHEYGRLDILVNNAGITLIGSVEDLDLAAFRKTLDVDLVGTFLGCKHMLPLLKNSVAGSIVNIVSNAGLKASPHLIAYNAAKAGATLMTKSIALHCARSGTKIRVNSIHPGVIRTAILDKVLAQVDDPEALMASFVAAHPVGHIGEPEDVSEMILYLASDRSRFMTGAELVIDGGSML